MNSLERLLASAKGEPTDCVPVCPGIGHYAAMQAHQPMTKVAHDPELMSKVVLRSLKQHQYDSCGPITDYGLGTESMGSTSLIRDWEQTCVVEFAVEDKKDIVGLTPPDPFSDGRMPVTIECERILMETVGETIGVNGGLAGPLSFAANLRGPEKILYDLYEDPSFVHDLLEVSTESAIAFGEAQVRSGQVKTMNVYDPIATLISTEMVEEFSFPYLARLFSHLENLGTTLLLHICADTTRLLEGMVAVGADILSLDGEVDLATARSIVGDRATISGNVATQTLYKYQPDVVYKESCSCIEKAGAGGRFTLSSSCEVPLETPPENIDAMVRAARDFGAEFVAG